MIQRILFFLLVMGFYAPVFAEQLEVYTEDLPPLNVWDAKQKKATGFSVEIVESLLKRTNLTPKGGAIKVYPWARAYMIAQEEKNVILFSMTRTESRESLFKWVGPIAPRTVWFWKMKSRKDIVVNSFKDAKRYTVGGVNKFAISEYLKNEGFKVDMNTNIDSNWLKLFANRIDLGTALDLEAAYYMKKHGRRIADLERLVKIDDQYSFYIALSMKTSDDIVNRLQQAFNQLKAEGSYYRLWKKYLE